MYSKTVPWNKTNEVIQNDYKQLKDLRVKYPHLIVSFSFKFLREHGFFEIK